MELMEIVATARHQSNNKTVVVVVVVLEVKRLFPYLFLSLSLCFSSVQSFITNTGRFCGGKKIKHLKEDFDKKKNSSYFLLLAFAKKVLF